MVITNVNKVVYQGDGVTTAFPFTFRIIDDTDIKLLLVDSDGTETDIISDYYVDTVNNTVYYPGYAPGAEPALSDRPPVLAEGQRLVIYRKLPITQEKNLGDKWPFSVIELGLDKLTMLIQDWKDILDRCLKVRVSDAQDGFDATITPMAGRAIEINADGNGFVCVDSPSTVLHECEAIRDEVAADADEVAYNTENVRELTNTASNAAAAAIQANNSAQGALIDADALLNATKGYISAATVDGFWNAATTYEPGDCTMTADGAVYRCIQTSTNKPPATNPNYWAQITTTELMTFEIDNNGDLMPLINPSVSQNWDIDENDDIMPSSLDALVDVDNQEF